MLESIDLQAISTDYVIPWGINFIIALLIFMVGRIISRWLVNIIGKILTKTGMDSILVDFISSIARTVLLLLVIIAALNQLGVDTTSLIALLGAAGLAVGLALKDSLQNFASGVMLIIFRPFEDGDYIEAAGVSGSVEKVGIFSTALRTGDNREIIIPNGKIYSGNIINNSACDTRRIDLTIGIGYDDDLKKARDLLNTIIKADTRILSEPAPSIAVADLADSSVNFTVRSWVNRSDYSSVRSELLENIKLSFDEQGISLPYPQMDVHLQKSE